MLLGAIKAAKLEKMDENTIRKIYLDTVGQELVFSVDDDSNPYLEYTKRTGVIHKSGGIFMNGRFIELNDAYQQNLMETLAEMREHLQGEMYAGNSDVLSVNIEEYFMGMRGVSKRWNKYVFGEGRVLDLAVKNMRDGAVVDRMGWIGGGGDEVVYSFIVVDDFETPWGLDTAHEALKFVQV